MLFRELTKQLPLILNNCWKESFEEITIITISERNLLQKLHNLEDIFNKKAKADKDTNIDQGSILKRKSIFKEILSKSKIFENWDGGRKISEFWLYRCHEFL